MIHRMALPAWNVSVPAAPEREGGPVVLEPSEVRPPLIGMTRLAIPGGLRLVHVRVPVARQAAPGQRLRIVHSGAPRGRVTASAWNPLVRAAQWKSGPGVIERDCVDRDHTRVATHVVRVTAAARLGRDVAVQPLVAHVPGNGVVTRHAQRRLRRPCEALVAFGALRLERFVGPNDLPGHQEPLAGRIPAEHGPAENARQDRK